MNNPYKEIVSAFLLLFIIYLNYIVLTPFYLGKSYYKTFFFLSILLILISSIIELQMVESDISKCITSLPPPIFKKYLRNVQLLIFLRNAGFYLFFTVLKLYLQTKDHALLEKKIAFKDTGLIMLMPLRGTPIAINIKYVSYFSQHKNNTFIHSIIGKSSSIYSSLSNIQDYLEFHCLRINRETLITFTNIISYNNERIIVKGEKGNSNVELPYYKNESQKILQILHKKVPDLDENNNKKFHKNTFGGVNEYENNEVGGINNEIFEEIRENPGINAQKLFEIYSNQLSLRTIERRLKELTDSGFIEFKGSLKKGGYYLV
jgi:hypothetical protein